jgi:hypothetical protein
VRCKMIAISIPAIQSMPALPTLQVDHNNMPLQPTMAGAFYILAYRTRCIQPTRAGTATNYNLRAAARTAHNGTGTPIVPRRQHCLLRAAAAGIR